MTLTGYTLIATGVLAAIFAAYFFWSQNQIGELRTDLADEITAREITEETINTLKEDLRRNIKSLEQVEKETDRIKEKSKELSGLLSRHDLSYLASQKPGLIERRANGATDEVLQDLRDISDKDWTPSNTE